MFKFLFATLVTTAITMSAMGAAPTCKRVHAISLVQSQTDFLEKQVDLLVGKKNPTWVDFENLRNVRNNIEALIRVLHKTEGESGLVEFYQDWDFASARLSHLLKKTFAQTQFSDKYGPTDFALRKAYRDEFESLMELFPIPHRIQLNSIPSDTRKATLVQEAIETITQQEERLREIYPTTNYKTEAELVQAIRLKGKPEIQQNLELLMREDFEFAMRRPEEGRFWIPKVGFHNQFVTGSSKGTLSSDSRNKAEAALLGIEKNEYENLDKDLKPKYGFLLPKLGQGIDRTNAYNYGSDIYILNKDALRKRTTITPGDSLNTGYYAHRDLKTPILTPIQWDQTFIPWSQRALIAPTLIADSYNKGVLPENYYSIEIGIDLPRFERKKANHISYVEMQYWGPVTLSDVVAFVFTASPPTGDFLAELKKRNIKIYHQVDDKYVPWNSGDTSK